MKFLVDTCAGHRLAEWLRQQGHDVLESRDRGRDPGDRTLLHWAQEEDRVVITMDKDFGRIIFFEKASHCGLIRLPDLPAAQRIALLEHVLIQHENALLEKAIITVCKDRIRIARNE